MHRILSEENVENLNLELPDECPICKVKMITKGVLGISFSKDSLNHLRVVFNCSNKKCKEVFIGYYILPTYKTHDAISLRVCAPIKSTPEKIDDKIIEVSPSFYKTYNQAKSAEEKQLDEICGMGYRKSLEFLIKDFLIYKNPDQIDKIKDNHKLANVINNYIDNERLKDVAHRAAWLGNDHSHYTQKWKDQDLTDLKILIRLTLSWIQQEIEYDYYMEEMNS